MYTDGICIVCDEIIKLNSNDGEVIGYKPGYKDGITLCVVKLTCLGYSYVSFDGCNVVNI